jgi:hypothetical protein
MTTNNTVMVAGTTPAATTILRAALEYAARGWPILPIKPRGKTPITAHGLKDATTDVDVVRAWWDETPDANIGIATDHFVVVDCDGPIGKHNWLKFIAGIGFATSPYAWTGGGGLHVWYRRDGHPVRNRAGWLEHVDIRSAGGYVIVPPSIHPSGADYWWNTSPDELDVPPMPSRLVDALTERPKVHAHTGLRIARSVRDAYARTALDAEVDKVRTAPVGQRNQTLVAAAFSLGQLVEGRKLSHEAVIAELFAAATALGLGDTEATRTIASGLQAGKQHPRRK